MKKYISPRTSLICLQEECELLSGSIIGSGGASTDFNQGEGEDLSDPIHTTNSQSAIWN